MNKFLMHRNLYTDPLTNLKNFIQFIEEDFQALFGDTGVICVLDIAKLREINSEYGREVGDLFIRTSAHVLTQYFERSQIFRMEGDSFTIVLRDHMGYGIESLLDEIDNHYSRLLLEKGYSGHHLHRGVYQYDEAIRSVEDYYMFTVKTDSEYDVTRKFTGDSLVRHILSGVVNRFRQSLEYYDQVYNYALIDEVSGLPNAKAANQYLASMTRSTSRKTDKYCVLFIDGDDLRRYNDISYQAGNAMIRNLGQIIKETIRDDDQIFRWLSGDEFLVILEDTDTYTGEMLAERIRQSVEAHQYEFTFNTTISIGVSSYPMDGRDVDTVIYYAEKANKLAKDQGKNMVVAWREVDVTRL